MPKFKVTVTQEITYELIIETEEGEYEESLDEYIDDNERDLDCCFDSKVTRRITRVAEYEEITTN